MRARLVRLLLKRMEGHIPSPVGSIALQILLNATARAYGKRRVRIWRLPWGQALKAYGAFSQRCLRESTASPGRVFEEAYRLGAWVRRMTGFREREDLESLVFFLYRLIGIRMDGSLPGKVRVSACFFSSLYAPSECKRMSSMDAGLIAGIFGGGSLVFSRRITEGCEECEAHFEKREVQR